MKFLQSLVLLSAFLPGLQVASTVAATTSKPAGNLSFSQGQRMATDLKQGMSAETVEKLLGKPRQTALRNDSSCRSNNNTQGVLQWTYIWNTENGQSSLRVEFAAKSPEAWLVNNWEWAS